MGELKITTENLPVGSGEGLHAKRLTITHVYVCKIPFDVESELIYPEDRLKEIQSASSQKLRWQKFYVWKLLEYALRSSFGLKMQSLKFEKKNGKWACDGCEFSVSHCNDVVAAAVSNNAVGVDVELINPARFTENLARKIASERELAELLPLSGEERALKLNAMWTVKEAAFKRSPNKAFVPCRVETSGAPHATKRIRCGNGDYFVTVVSQFADSVKFILLGVESV